MILDDELKMLNPAIQGLTRKISTLPSNSPERSALLGDLQELQAHKANAVRRILITLKSKVAEQTRVVRSPDRKCWRATYKGLMTSGVEVRELYQEIIGLKRELKVWYESTRKSDEQQVKL